MKYVVDTHALIWFLEGNPRLGTNAKAILSHPDSRLIIPATTLSEAVWIVEKKENIDFFCSRFARSSRSRFSCDNLSSG
ncbi:MAG: type II toxin-antitoxin system VapC family toxin [Rivularia sp. (in: cyanobacteria)]